MDADKLVRQLREGVGWQRIDTSDRIEALAAELTTQKAALKEAVEVLTLMMRSVCGPTGFADAVRHNSGLAYPWPSLDVAEAKARAFLTKHGGA